MPNSFLRIRLGLILASVLLLSLTTGCGGNSASREAVKASKDAALAEAMERTNEDARKAREEFIDSEKLQVLSSTLLISSNQIHEKRYSYWRSPKGKKEITAIRERVDEVRRAFRIAMVLELGTLQQQRLMERGLAHAEPLSKVVAKLEQGKQPSQKQMHSISNVTYVPLRKAHRTMFGE